MLRHWLASLSRAAVLAKRSKKQKAGAGRLPGLDVSLLEDRILFSAVPLPSDGDLDHALDLLDDPTHADSHEPIDLFGTDSPWDLSSVAVGEPSLSGLMARPKTDAPTITALDDVFLIEDQAMAPQLFYVADGDTPLAQLDVTVESSDHHLIPLENISLLGTRSDRAISLFPAADQFGGPVTITLTVSDGTHATTESFDVNVQSANDAPVTFGLADFVELTENGQIVDLWGAFEDAEDSDAQLQFTIESNSHPNLFSRLEIDHTTGKLILEFAAGVTGDALLAIRATDSDGAFVQASYDVQAPLYTGPSIGSLPSVTLAEDAAAHTIVLPISDPDTPLGQLEVLASSSNHTLIPLDHLSLSFTDGQHLLVIDSADNQYGDATIAISVSDGSSAETREFQVAVLAVNDTPTAVDPAPHVTITESHAVVDLWQVFHDVEDTVEQLQYSVAANDNPNLFAGTTFDQATGKLTFDFAAAVAGQAQLTLRATDTAGEHVDVGYLLVSPTVANEAPTIQPLSDLLMDEDHASSPIPILLADADTPLQDLEVQVVSDNTALLPLGALTLSGSDGERSLVVQPAANQAGFAEVTVSVSDGHSTTVQQFQVTVRPVNDAPTTSGLEGHVQVTSTQAEFDLRSAFDDLEDGRTGLTYSVIGNTAPGLFSAIQLDQQNDRLTMQFASGATGDATVTVRATDSAGAFVDAAYTIQLLPNPGPTIAPIGDQMLYEDMVSRPINLILGDPDTPSRDLQVTIQSSNHNLIPVENLRLEGTGPMRSLTIEPVANGSGTATISVIVSDGQTSTVETFEVTVQSINDIPTFVDPAQHLTTSGMQSTIDLWSIFADTEDSDQQLTYSVSGNNNPGLFNAVHVDMTTGELTATYAPDITGRAELMLRATDSAGAYVEITATLLSPENIGTTYYVSTTGSDTNSGLSVQQAFRSISYAVHRTSPGDTVLVSPGTYTEMIERPLGGSSWDAPVRVAALDSDIRPIIRAPAGSTHVLLINSAASSYMEFDGFVIDASDATRDGIKITYSGNQGAHHLRFQNLEIKNAPNQGVLIAGDQYGVGYNEFVNLDVHNNGTTRFGHGFYVSAPYTTIINSQIHDNGGWGIHNYGGNPSHNRYLQNEIWNNAAAGNGGAGIGVYTGSDILVDGNAIWGQSIGIEVDYEASHVYLVANETYDNLSYGITIGERTGADIEMEGNRSFSNSRLDLYLRTLVIPITIGYVL